MPYVDDPFQFGPFFADLVMRSFCTGLADPIFALDALAGRISRFVLPTALRSGATRTGESCISVVAIADRMSVGGVGLLRAKEDVGVLARRCSPATIWASTSRRHFIHALVLATRSGSLKSGCANYMLSLRHL